MGTPSSTSVAFSSGSSTEMDWVTSLKSGSSTNWTKERGPPPSGGLRRKARLLGWKYTSPHSRREKAAASRPGWYSEYTEANDWSVKHQSIVAEAKMTDPSSGESRGCSPPLAALSTALTSSITWRHLKKASCGGSLSSRMSRSILFRQRTIFTRWATACLMSRSR